MLLSCSLPSSRAGQPLSVTFGYQYGAVRVGVEHGTVQYSEKVIGPCILGWAAGAGAGAGAVAGLRLRFWTVGLNWNSSWHSSRSTNSTLDDAGQREPERGHRVVSTAQHSTAQHSTLARSHSHCHRSPLTYSTCPPSHDALRAHGIIPQKAPSRSPSPELPNQSELRDQALKQATVDDIDLELEDALGDEEEQILLRLRQQRIAQLATETKRHRFGRVYPIGRPDYTREVTEASKLDSDPDGDQDDPHETGAASALAPPKSKGTGVVCFLYKDG